MRDFFIYIWFMRIMLAIIGAGAIWLIKGRKNKFTDVLYGGDKGKNRIPEDENIWLGLTILVTLGLLLSLIKE